MESFILKVQDAEYRLAMPTAQVCMAEKALGGESLINAMDRIDSVFVQQTLLWAALQKYNHGMTQDKTSGIMDAMRDGCVIDGDVYADFSIDTRVKLCIKILMAAGFFTDAASKDISDAWESANQPSSLKQPAS